MGLTEANQILTLNGLRQQITLRTDGGIKTGRDVVIAAMMGAEEFGIGTTSLVAVGCIMVRQCHSNTCLKRSVLPIISFKFLNPNSAKISLTS